MRLFMAMEKCFPEMRKHRKMLYEQYPKEYWNDLHLHMMKREMQEWIIDQYLDSDSMLYKLFVQAGFKSKREMALNMLCWHTYDWNIERHYHTI